jgi:ribosomal protein S5
VVRLAQFSKLSASSDVIGKSFGSSNHANVVKATLQALTLFARVTKSFALVASRSPKPKAI